MGRGFSAGTFDLVFGICNTTDSSATPEFYGFDLYEGVGTDTDGDYNFTLTAPSSLGVVSVVINSTYAGLTGTSSEDLTVTDITAPSVVINTPVNGTSYTLGSSVVFNLTVTDDIALETCVILWMELLM